MGITIDQELAEISDLALKIKDNYSVKLKTDKVAMLTDLQLEIKESCICMYEVNKLIQQKINSLKEDEKNE